MLVNGQPRPSLSGTYELAAAVHTGQHPAREISVLEDHVAAADGPRALENGSRHTGRLQYMSDGRMSTHTGRLQYMSDGRMSTDLEVRRQDGRVQRTGYSGRWCTHAAQAGGRPPHGDCELVEHQVLSSSDPALVGQQIYQQFELSEDGERLTTIDMRIIRGQVRTMEQLEWRRTSVSPTEQQPVVGIRDPPTWTLC